MNPGMYSGAAGVHAVASLFLLRGYNVAFPEIDRGAADDLFVEMSETGEFRRIQVKASSVPRSRVRAQSLRYTVNIQKYVVLSKPRADYFVFAFFFTGQWIFALFSTASMRTLYEAGTFGADSYDKQKRRDIVNLRFDLTPSTPSLFVQKHDYSSHLSHVEEEWAAAFPRRF